MAEWNYKCFFCGHTMTSPAELSGVCPQCMRGSFIAVPDGFLKEFDDLVEAGTPLWEVKKAMMKAGGYEPSDVPLKSLVDFSELVAMFDDTHNHLGMAYDLVEAELQLQGKGYYPIKKALTYYVESLRQPTYSFMVGAAPGDNRIHLVIILGAGRGKGQIRKMVGQYGLSKYERTNIFPATRINIEQLIGRPVKQPKGVVVEERGYLGYKGVVVDECQDLIGEAKTGMDTIMIEFRNAMEVWHKNTVQKKLTSEELMEYDPEGRFMLLMHPTNFPPIFFDRGTARRPFAFKAGGDPIPLNAGIASLFEAMPTSQFKEFVNARSEWPMSVQFGPEAIQELAEWINTWNLWTLTHPNQRVRALGQKNFTSAKDQFIRMAAILTVKRNEAAVTPQTVAAACMDCIHFLLCTYEVYANESRINLSRDTWRTSDPLEAMLFEWLHWNNATSMESSKLTIAQVQDQISTIFGAQERQARGIFSRLVESGHLGRAQVGKHDSRAWVNFVPDLGGGVMLGAFEKPDLMAFISKKMDTYKLRVARVQSLTTLRTRVPRESFKINTNTLLEKEPFKEIDATPHPPTLATLDPQIATLNPKENQKDGTIDRVRDIFSDPKASGGLYLGHGFDGLAPDLRPAALSLAQVGEIYEPREGVWKAVKNAQDDQS